ncbi:LOW QUALITY PROTEIN: hypothetical protein KIPB_002092 [Kipferlia bialata]|uniref:WW domain-containing protein n=1 Tax=Kipferlia bialata TaxID=797122 RepID=A0A9K3GFV3_9EUKA|nr:LOW QUALITY PROTEIN: hypothetical protein KIPB_002092 [Kipferlia bialata]
MGVYRTILLVKKGLSGSIPVQWEHPLVEKASLAALGLELPIGWASHKDSSGDVYYFNTARGITCWEHPQKKRLLKQLVLRSIKSNRRATSGRAPPPLPGTDVTSPTHTLSPSASERDSQRPRQKGITPRSDSMAAPATLSPTTGLVSPRADAETDPSAKEAVTSPLSTLARLRVKETTRGKKGGAFWEEEKKRLEAATTAERVTAELAGRRKPSSIDDETGYEAEMDRDRDGAVAQQRERELFSATSPTVGMTSSPSASVYASSVSAPSLPLPSFSTLPVSLKRGIEIARQRKAGREGGSREGEEGVGATLWHHGFCTTLQTMLDTHIGDDATLNRLLCMSGTGDAHSSADIRGQSKKVQTLLAAKDKRALLSAEKALNIESGDSFSHQYLGEENQGSVPLGFEPATMADDLCADGDVEVDEGGGIVFTAAYRKAMKEDAWIDESLEKGVNIRAIAKGKAKARQQSRGHRPMGDTAPDHLIRSIIAVLKSGETPRDGVRRLGTASKGASKRPLTRKEQRLKAKADAKRGGPAPEDTASTDAKAAFDAIISANLELLRRYDLNVEDENKERLEARLARVEAEMAESAADK